MRNPLFLFILLVFCVGCGDGYVVSGKVTFPDGTPLPRGQVTFFSSTFTGGGNVGSDGSYKVTVGVPAGTYKVTVIALGESSPDPNVPIHETKPVPSLVDTKFNSPDTSGLVCEVKGKTAYNIPVEAPK